MSRRDPAANWRPRIARHSPYWRTGACSRILESGLAHESATGSRSPSRTRFDGFKQVNDAYGHDAGDVVLCETARRLLSIVRTADVVARIGGDEFVIVYEPNQSGSERLIARVNEVLAAPINISADIAVLCPASVGYADTRTAGRDPGALLAAADAAMYEAKRPWSLAPCAQAPRSVPVSTRPGALRSSRLSLSRRIESPQRVGLELVIADLRRRFRCLEVGLPARDC